MAVLSIIRQGEHFAVSTGIRGVHTVLIATDTLDEAKKAAGAIKSFAKWISEVPMEDRDFVLRTVMIVDNSKPDEETDEEYKIRY